MTPNSQPHKIPSNLQAKPHQMLAGAVFGLKLPLGCFVVAFSTIRVVVSSMAVTMSIRVIRIISTVFSLVPITRSTIATVTMITAVVSIASFARVAILPLLHPGRDEDS